MTARHILTGFVLLGAFSGMGWAQTGLVSTYAGNGALGYNGDGIAATSASITNPAGLAADANGNLFIADLYGRIRRVDVNTGIITTVAGGGTGGDGVLATTALLTGPCFVKLDATNNIYISDSCQTAAQQGGGGGGTVPPPAAAMNRIRRVDAVSGIITTIAGSTAYGYSGDGGLATNALLNTPADLAIDGAGNIFVADYGNYRVRRIDAVTGMITTVAGNGVSAFAGDGGAATAASLLGPFSLAVDGAGNLYVGDVNRIRRIDAVTGIIATVPVPVTAFSMGMVCSGRRPHQLRIWLDG